MAGNTHIINHAEVIIQMPRQPNAKEVSQWVQQHLLTAVEQVLDEQQIGEDEWLVVDKLSISINMPAHDVENWQIAKSRITQQIQQAVQQCIAQQKKVTPTQSNEERLGQQWMDYLRQGWSKSPTDISQIKEWLSSQKGMEALTGRPQKQLLQLLENADAFRRFAQMLPPHTIAHWLQHWWDKTQPTTELSFSFWQELLAALPAANLKHQAYWQAVWLHKKEPRITQIQQVLIAAGIGPNTLKRLAQIAQHLSPASRHILLEAHHAPINKKSNLNDNSTMTINDETNSDKIAVSNAGLILLAPFLPAFFNTLTWQPQKDKHTANQCVLALHYLACGQYVAEDWELVLPKLLCGIPLSNACGGTLAATPLFEQEANALLQSIIQHWQKLGNTSKEGLRVNFLQRPGLLQWKTPSTQLFIVEQTADILLQFIPWNFRLIKLPWMPQLLTVKWGD